MAPSIAELQQRVADFIAANDLEAAAPARVLDLVSEVGELAKEILKGSDYGRIDFALTNAWDDELGDVLFALLALANTTGLDLETVLAATLQKYQRRVNDKQDAGSGR